MTRTAPSRAEPTLNRTIANRLRVFARLIGEQDPEGFRRRAYERAAEVVEGLPRPVSEILLDEGLAGLEALPAIGPSIAAAVARMATTGDWPQLRRLQHAATAEDLFRRLPGVGPGLAALLAEDLHLGGYEDLEQALRDGRLAAVPGLGPRRLAMLADGVAARLTHRPIRPPHGRRPSVATILDVDREYAEAVEAGTLKRITPRRFNPGREAWLPVLHTRRGPWRFTALYSNSARAHRLGRQHDWVLVYHEADDGSEGQHTVVTEIDGRQRGRRVVRGREREGSGPSPTAPVPSPTIAFEGGSP